MLRAAKVFASGLLTGVVSLYVALWTGALELPLRLPGAAPVAPSRAAVPSASPLAPVTPTGSFTSPSAPPPQSPSPVPDSLLREAPFVLAAGLTPTPSLTDLQQLGHRALLFPIQGFDLRRLHDSFADRRGSRAHEALDILSPRGTPVLAVDDGVVGKLFVSVRGGNTVYEIDAEGVYCYYYAHLDRYAEALKEGQSVRKGQILGYVGTSGNAAPDTPHLHFAIFRLGPEKHWWEGESVNPFSLWVSR